VVVFYAGEAVIDTSIERALSQFDAFNELSVPPDEAPTQPAPEGGGQPPPAPNATVESLLQQATQVYNDAQAALRNGNFARYGELNQQLGRLLQQAADALAGNGGGSSTSTSSTTTTRPPADTSSGSQAVRAGR
jgi:hypothetical protein